MLTKSNVWIFPPKWQIVDNYLLSMPECQFRIDEKSAFLCKNTNKVEHVQYSIE